MQCIKENQNQTFLPTHEKNQRLEHYKFIHR